MPVERHAIQVVHLVAKTHLDLGFTALASEVEERYLDEFFPRAIDVAEELERRAGPERLVWTTGSWILHRALIDGVPRRAERVEAAVRAGQLAWHGLPLTTHTELMDAGLVRAGLALGADLDERFDRTTTAAKMTDVPGHTRGLVPLLAEAGIHFLHLGVNPAWPLPDVPAAFRWRAPDGAEVTVAYQAGGYGGEVRIEGCDEVLAFLHAGDNLGPPSLDEVVAAHAELAARHPEAEIRASTLDAFARALAASGAVAHLPVVTAEIGDPWLFGAGSDPTKVAAYRRVLAARRSLAASLHPEVLRGIDRDLLLVAEHTWGLDQKVALPEDRRWDRAGLAQVRAEPAGERFEASWAEQRRYVDRAVERLAPDRSDGESIVATVEERAARTVAWPLDAAGSVAAGYRAVAAGERVELPGWTVAIGPSGEVVELTTRASGRTLADATHPLGLVTYQSFDETDYERFYAQLAPIPDDEWWATWDNTKPGIDACGAVHGSWPPTLAAAWTRTNPTASCAEVVVHLRFEGLLADRLGAPPEAWVRWFLTDDGSTAEANLWWAEKPANRLPEAMWCSFVPAVAEPERWTMDKLGQQVSPLDVVRRGGRSLHAVGEGLRYRGPDGGLDLRTPDAPLVAPGRPNLLDADPPLPDLAGGFHVLLLDNCWGTNFPMWVEGPADFSFSLVLSPAA